MRYVYLVLFFVVVLAVSLLGLRGTTSVKPPLEVFPDMDRQAKYKPQAESAFFADGRTERPIPAGTVDRSALRSNSHLYEGKTGDAWATNFPAEIEINQALMVRGKERFGIYCAPCHGALGDGRGIVTQYGWGTPANFHSDLFRNMPVGEIYNTITHGKNTMFSYADKLTPEDRWAVIGYVRSLQRAFAANIDDVPAAQKAELSKK